MGVQLGVEEVEVGGLGEEVQEEAHILGKNVKPYYEVVIVHQEDTQMLFAQMGLLVLEQKVEG